MRLNPTAIATEDAHGGFPSLWRWRFRRERPWYIPRQGWNRHLDTVRSAEACHARGVRPRSEKALAPILDIIRK
jgi:hypothetical protein